MKTQQSPSMVISFGLGFPGTYPLIITGRQCMGTYKGSPIYRVTSMRFLNCNRSLQNSTSQEKRDEAHFLALLKSLEKTPGLYFSYDSDLTLNVQRSKEIGILGGSPLWKQVSHNLCLCAYDEVNSYVFSTRATVCLLISSKVLKSIGGKANHFITVNVCSG
jgi:hypothetical protein